MAEQQGGGDGDGRSRARGGGAPLLVICGNLTWAFVHPRPQGGGVRAGDHPDRRRVVDDLVAVAAYHGRGPGGSGAAVARPLPRGRAGRPRRLQRCVGDLVRHEPQVRGAGPGRTGHGNVCSRRSRPKRTRQATSTGTSRSTPRSCGPTSTRPAPGPIRRRPWPQRGAGPGEHQGETPWQSLVARLVKVVVEARDLAARGAGSPARST